MTASLSDYSNNLVTTWELIADEWEHEWDQLVTTHFRTTDGAHLCLVGMT